LTIMVLADRLREARRRRFVGRAAELELFETALETSPPPFAVLFVHGPGGVGKTALLRTLGEAAEQAGLPVTYVDMRSIAPSPPAFLAAAGRGEERRVLLLDTYEAGAAIDGWLRERYLPELPSDAVVVIAGRDGPAPAWRSDPGWGDLLRTVSLRNLDRDDARAYLRLEGVPASQHEAALAATHGHPLALRLLVDVLAQGSGPVELGAAPDVVRELLDRFVADAPSARHREALDICAHARFTTEDLLADALGSDASALFDWLRGLSFIEQGPEGAFPHDIVRDALDVDQHRRIRQHVIGRVRETSGAEQQRGIADLIFLHRNNPFAHALWDWASFGAAYAEPARPEDRDSILAMVERHEGRESRTLAEYWLDRQPESFVAFRGADAEPLGFLARLALHRASEQDIDGDPGTRAMWAYVVRHGPPRPGDEVLCGRFFMDRDAYQGPSPSFNVMTISATQVWLSHPRLAWELLGAWSDRAATERMMRYIGYHHAPEATYEVGGREYHVFANDWRHRPIEDWLDMMGEQELEAEAPAPPATPLVALSQPEFAAAARQALRDLHRPDALAANPLQRARMAHGASLAELIEQAVGALRADARDAKLARAVERTYLRPAPTQEAAADVLGLPFSTYRRHLTRGVERVVDWLWHRELYGAE
jgi:DNA-directed RNA polymerase specialized sigma24 family protein